MRRPSFFRTHVLAVLTLILAPGASGFGSIHAEAVLFTEGLGLKVTGLAARSPVHVDPVEARIVGGGWIPPKAGEQLPGGTTNQTWSTIKADTNGWFSGESLRGGYAAFTYMSTSPDPRVVLLEARGHNWVYINQELRPGDPYQTGTAKLPFVLHPGLNQFLFQVGRGRLNAAVRDAKSPVFMDLADLTAPDLLPGSKETSWAALVVINATTNALEGLEIEARPAQGRVMVTRSPRIPATSLRKVPLQLDGTAATLGQPCSFNLVLRDPKTRQTLDTSTLSLRTRSPQQTRKVTFISKVDGSVQYYSVNPSSDPKPAPGSQALFLSLHGASVEAQGQADAYAPKNWGSLVAPTNRRPYGFDWEEIGRADALEVLDLATAALRPDPSRIYLTGHSMGGHGTWQLGVTFPDKFAAIGPSAGWISFNTYANGARFTNNTPIEHILRRAASSSDTLAMRSNLLHQAVYILHGDADDNVPISEARDMRDQLAGFHRDWTLYEQPKAGHWWDASDEPGADCVDWLPMFDLFARRVRPASSAVRHLTFTTMNPAVSASCHWAAIEAQTAAQIGSSIDLTFDPGKGRIRGTTFNVERLRLDLQSLGAPEGLELVLDGQELRKPAPSPGETHLWLQRLGGHWAAAIPAHPALKGPQRGGPFKAAFNNRMMFVYATSGTPAENDWSRRKAQLDAESFWYRGNGAVDVIPDREFDSHREPDRNVIIYGNSESNSAWKQLLGGSPIMVRRDLVRVGDKLVGGDDLACVFLRPRANSSVAHVAVIAGTGLPGMRLLDRYPFFTAGVAYPDWMLADTTSISNGISGVKGAGFFGTDWSLERGETVWNTPRTAVR